MSSVTLCVPYFMRKERLRALLESAQSRVNHIVVADQSEGDGDVQEISEDLHCEVTVVDLEYDAGLGRCRLEAYREAKEYSDYILVADSDHELTGDHLDLLCQLEAAPEYGGLAGNLVEPDHSRFWQSAKDFVEKEGYLVRTAGMEKEMKMVADQPLVEFDFIPWPSLIRVECLEDYAWDPDYPRSRLHADFFVGHWKKTDWKFGINPEVSFRHYPGGDSEYERERYESGKTAEALNRFRDKWGYKKMLGHENNNYWFDTHA